MKCALNASQALGGHRSIQPEASVGRGTSPQDVLCAGVELPSLGEGRILCLIFSFVTGEIGCKIKYKPSTFQRACSG